MPRIASLLALSVLALVLVAVLRPEARAEPDSGFRCGARVVGRGDHMMEVREKCGDPDFISQRLEKRKRTEKVRRRSPDGWVEEVSEEREVEILIDEWLYDLGDRRFVRHVWFENNRVVGVETGARGSKRG